MTLSSFAKALLPVQKRVGENSHIKFLIPSQASTSVRHVGHVLLSLNQPLMQSG